MKFHRYTDHRGSHTAVLESSKLGEIYDDLISRWGLAVLYYKPLNRLSVSWWGFGRAHNVKLFGREFTF